MNKALLLLCLLLFTGCKKDVPAGSKLAAQLEGKWNDADDGSLAWEFSSGGKCKVFGDMDCSWQAGAETGSTLKLRYKAVDSWDDIEVTFEGPDKVTWKDLTMLKSDPDDDEAVTKLVRVK
jgi:hypothetical protein